MNKDITSYSEAVKAIKQAILQSQSRAAQIPFRFDDVRICVPSPGCEGRNKWTTTSSTRISLTVKN